MLPNNPKYYFKLDLEAIASSQLKDPLMKYKTMATNGELKEIELSSEYSEFEESESSITGSSNMVRSNQINSQRGEPSHHAFSKLLPSSHFKQYSSKWLLKSPRLTCQQNSINFSNSNKSIRLSTRSNDENRSLRSKNEIQRKALINMLKIMGKILWFIIYCVALSATPALLIGLPGDNMLILMTWKLQITLIVFIILSALELAVTKELKKKFKPLNFKKCFHVGFAGLMYLLWLLGLLEACRKSIVLHALLLNNFCVFLVPVSGILFKRYMGSHQIFGVIVWVIGGLLCLYSSYSGEWVLNSKIH